MQNGDKDIAVTVIVAAYNQERYIRDCLEGVVRQKTTFAFEALVHDDASTDGTAAIIREYAEAYPGLIIPVIERENQYSRGDKAFDGIDIPSFRGRYLAYCEGDDYWIDTHKLQAQFEFMEAHPDYALCLHNSIVCDLYHGIDYLSEPMRCDCDKSCERIIEEGGGKRNVTGSFFIRRSFEQPSIKHYCSARDHFEMIKLASRGSVRWFTQPMSVYRWGVADSWTDRRSHSSMERTRRHVAARVEALQIYDRATSGIYHDAFETRIAYERSRLIDAEQRERLSRCPSPWSVLRCQRVEIRVKLSVLIDRALPAQLGWSLRRFTMTLRCRRAHTLVAQSNQSYLDRLAEGPR